jgi:hypothetical protein
MGETCSNCRHWDWYYRGLNYGHCAVTGDLNIGKDTPACEHFELSKKVLESTAAGGDKK